MAHAATAVTAISFDINTCIGFQAPEHAHPIAGLSAEWLCPSCSDALTLSVSAPKPAKHTRPTCPAGGHAAGSRWSTCLACYGD